MKSIYPDLLKKSPFILGTAQLGLTYGIANNSGKPSYEHVLKIIKSAWQNGIVGFDTATAYGDSEQLLGQAFSELGITDSVYVITKLRPEDISSTVGALEAIKASVARLKIFRLWSVLAHSEADYLKRQDQYDNVFLQLKRAGLTELTGVSVYSAEQANRCLISDQIDIVQMPLNAFDQRAVSEHAIELALQQNKMLLFRSIYLQGLLLLAPEDLPQNLKFAQPLLEEWQNLCQRFSLETRQAAYLIANSLRQGFPLIVGLETESQLLQNLELVRGTTPQKEFELATLKLCNKATEKLIDPSKW